MPGFLPLDTAGISTCIAHLNYWDKIRELYLLNPNCKTQIMHG